MLSNAPLALFNGFFPPAVFAAVLFGLALIFRRGRFGHYAFLTGVFGASTVALVLFALLKNTLTFLSEDAFRIFAVLVWGPVVEEAIKLGFLGLLIWVVRRWDRMPVANWALYGALIGYGFAAAEGFVFLFEDREEELQEGALLTRWLGTTQMHALAGAVAGLIAGSGTRFTGAGHGTIFRLLVAVAAAALIHGAWNCFAGGMRFTGQAGLSQGYALGTGVVLFCAIIGTWMVAEMVKGSKSS